MPVPIPAPTPGGAADVEVQPYYVRDTQPWAIDQERQRHNQAIYTVGEYAMFALMWHLMDFEAGLVGRCTRCTGTTGTTAPQIQDVYHQPTQNKCIDCYGTTFEGGYKALIVRPAIFSDTDDDETLQNRGLVNPNDIDVESTTDFRVLSNDYVFRANGDRYQLGVPQRVQLRTGFTMPTLSIMGIGYNHSRASYEDPAASVAYLIGPSAAALHDMLSRGRYFPEVFDEVEVIRAPLIPVGD